MENENITQKLDGLLARSKDSAAAGRELHRMLHDGRLQGNPEVERWLTMEMTKQEFVKIRLAALNAPNDMHRKCAGLALVQQAQKSAGLTQHERVQELTEIIRASGLHVDARVEAVKALDTELADTTGGMERMRIMKVLLLELGGAPQPVREAVAEAFAEGALNSGAGIYLVKEMVLSGKYGEVCERIGIKLVDFLLRNQNAGEVELIADHDRAPHNVRAHACAKLGRQIPKPPLRDENPTLMGMPLAAWMRKTGDEMEKARAANVTPDGGKGPGGKPKVAVRR